MYITASWGLCMISHQQGHFVGRCAVRERSEGVRLPFFGILPRSRTHPSRPFQWLHFTSMGDRVTHIYNLPLFPALAAQGPPLMSPKILSRPQSQGEGAASVAFGQRMRRGLSTPKRRLVLPDSDLQMLRYATRGVPPLGRS